MQTLARLTHLLNYTKATAGWVLAPTGRLRGCSDSLESAAGASSFFSSAGAAVSLAGAAAAVSAAGAAEAAGASAGGVEPPHAAKATDTVAGASRLRMVI